MQTYLETQENLSVLLERAREEGEVRCPRHQAQQAHLPCRKQLPYTREGHGVSPGRGAR